MKVIKRHLQVRRFKSASEWQESHRPINTFLMINCLLLSGFTRRVAMCIVELLIGQVTPFVALIQQVDLPYITRH